MEAVLPLGWSMQTAERFGAKVSIDLPGRGMFLLETVEPDCLDPLVRSVGGQVVARIDAVKALVVMGVASYLGLRGHRAVRFMGPVHVDQQRLAAALGALSAAKTAPLPLVS